MLCPFCNRNTTKVLESRQSLEKTSIRRRRECEKCLKRFTTYEKFEKACLTVIKKDGRREKFSNEKLLKSITAACIKTHTSEYLIEKIVESIEHEAFRGDKKEITTAQVGETVLKHLKETNEVAYLRYLSYFREYTSLYELLSEMKVDVSQIYPNEVGFQV